MQEQILLLKDNEIVSYSEMKKNKFIAYLLGFFLGAFGVHRFYLNEKIGGTLYIVSFLLTIIAPPFIAVVMVCYIIDGFYTWVLCDKYNSNVISKIMAKRNTSVLQE